MIDNAKQLGMHPVNPYVGEFHQAPPYPTVSCMEDSRAQPITVAATLEALFVHGTHPLKTLTRHGL